MSHFITFEKRDKVFRIHLNNPKGFNSLTIPQFLKVKELIDQADQDNDTLATLITSSGAFFSVGVNIKSISKMTGKTENYYLSEISSKNMLLVDVMLRHKKLLICALNGPVIGLVASLVCLCDLIYAIDMNKVYMSFPFTAIGLTNECGASASLVARIGLSKALEILCLNKKLSCREMFKLGLLNRVFQFQNIDEFNEYIIAKLNGKLRNLDGRALMENKRLVKQDFRSKVEGVVLRESMMGLDKWVANNPQKAFSSFLQSKRESKI